MSSARRTALYPDAPDSCHVPIPTSGICVPPASVTVVSAIPFILPHVGLARRTDVDQGRMDKRALRFRDNGTPTFPSHPGARQTRCVAHPRSTVPVGRAEVLDQIRERLADGGSALVCGPAGIGKSTVLEALAARSSQRRVLHAAAAEVESGLPYLTLIDLLYGITGTEIAGLPRHLRAALDRALARGTVP